MEAALLPLVGGDYLQHPDGRLLPLGAEVLNPPVNAAPLPLLGKPRPAESIPQLVLSLKARTLRGVSGAPIAARAHVAHHRTLCAGLLQSVKHHLPGSAHPICFHRNRATAATHKH